MFCEFSSSLRSSECLWQIFRDSLKGTYRIHKNGTERHMDRPKYKQTDEQSENIIPLTKKTNIYDFNMFFVTASMTFKFVKESQHLMY